MDRKAGLQFWRIGLLAASFLAGLGVSRWILAAQAQANCPAPHYRAGSCPCG